MYFRVHLFIANFGETKISLLYDLTAVLGGDIYCAFSTDVCESAKKLFRKLQLSAKVFMGEE